MQIDIPTLAVIGNQSSGKSSVLERLSHCPLPRGDGMVTKNPLVMSLRHASQSSVRIGTSLDPGQMEDVRVEEVAGRISALSEELVRRGDGRFEISELPIYLNINGPHLSDLTLIDLPGVYSLDRDMNPIEGIHDFLKGLYAKYCSSPTCTIICVLPATEDVTTQIARGWCREWDPKGDRSIGVLTKSDRVNDHKELCDRIAGVGRNNAGFRLGTIALRNSSSPTTAYGQVEEEELGFFRDIQRKQRDLKDGSFGLQALVSVLVGIQAKSLSGIIPSLLRSVQQQLREAETKLKEFPEELVDFRRAHSKMVLVSQAIIKTVSDMTEKAVELDNIPRELNFDARFAEMFDAYTVQLAALSASVLSKDMHTKLMEKMKENRGSMLDDVLNERILPSAIFEVLREWKEPTWALLSEIHNKMTEVLDFVVSKECSDNDQVKEWFQRTMHSFLDEKYAECNFLIKELEEKEEFINTQNDFYSQTIAKLNESKTFICLLNQILSQSSFASDDELLAKVDLLLRTSSPAPTKEIPSQAPVRAIGIEHSILSLQIKIYAYIRVARKRWVDDVCGFLRVKYVNYLLKHGDRFTLRKLEELGEEELMDMWQEDANITAQRNEITRSIEVLRYAEGLITNFKRK